jgi:hypothetical protein
MFREAFVYIKQDSGQTCHRPKSGRADALGIASSKPHHAAKKGGDVYGMTGRRKLVNEVRL